MTAFEDPRFDPDAFWRSNSVDEFAEEQGLQSAPELEKFLGGWPEDELNDDFENVYLRCLQNKPFLPPEQDNKN